MQILADNRVWRWGVRGERPRESWRKRIGERVRRETDVGRSPPFLLIYATSRLRTAWLPRTAWPGRVSRQWPGPAWPSGRVRIGVNASAAQPLTGADGEQAFNLGLATKKEPAKPKLDRPNFIPKRQGWGNLQALR